jgi:hypothetical protein
MSECGDRRVGDNEYEYDSNSDGDGGNNKCASRSLLLVMKNCVLDCSNIKRRISEEI